ncbi:YbaB/EbfC family nucleoid-associated protein [Butyricicoccus porcorum]|uniref:Nucleoid-associated protein CBW42_11970 n=1 Tax=Butyricicoccus porcorum TaxID=1945634 RepID=A0A252F1G8_9FIRM|nr:YbaB/EbfC family nucleoid-associated protein [Butyricicoccus porcorum]MCI6926702.1 YbaB/EbfC family nucleoid-associated protein [Butyricicoccus porcorum]MDD6987862.1 YbaB/EbfC family nucleoid-associated protein [Butyricicoccus porcorum]MDY4483907.1 YbaB/EbfC family nucleoid-associated protein [Butyricicoccus porcorum]OUM19638.1 YbaB/EbfC family nucleoid-associated protein [Butyricicoccus porcorum]
MAKGFKSRGMAGRGGAMGGMGGMNMNAMIKKAQKMQEEMVKAQEELGQKEYTATSGGGAVTAVVKGSNEIVSLKLNPEVVDPDDIEMLEDLIVTAVNQALKTADEESAAIMRQATGGGMPGMF